VLEPNHLPSATAAPTFIDSTDGVRVAVHDFGGDGPLLVLSHATGLCGHVWLPMAATLSNVFHCIALDYRGHGFTITPDTTTMAWSGMGHDLLAVIDAYSSGEPVFVAGHSMGGAAIVLAERLRPGAVARAWGFEPILYDAESADVPPPEGPNPMVEAARRRRAEFESRAVVYERYASKPPLNTLDPRALRAYVDFGFRDLPDGRVTLRCTPDREAETFSNSRSGAFEAAGTVSFDYLVAVSGDGQGPAVMAEHAAATHPRLSLVHYDDLTHFGPLEAPERIATDVIEWFTRR
jgi:pimeloyl-ACP methyl ester carboxylesterase